MNRKIIVLLCLCAGLLGQQLSDSLQFDPMTGRAYNVKIEQHFNPESGQLIVKRDTVWVESIKTIEKTPQSAEPATSITQQKNNSSFDPMTGNPVNKDNLTVISLARAYAEENYNKKMWTYCGGPATCGSLVAGGMIGGSILGAGGAIFGTIGAGILVPEFLSRVPSKEESLYPREFTPEERELYKKIYNQKLKEKRINSMYNGTLIGCGAFGFVILFITMMI